MSKKKTICFYAMTAILFALIFIVAVFLRVKTFEYIILLILIAGLIYLKQSQRITRLWQISLITIGLFFVACLTTALTRPNLKVSLSGNLINNAFQMINRHYESQHGESFIIKKMETPSNYHFQDWQPPKTYRNQEVHLKHARAYLLSKKQPDASKKVVYQIHGGGYLSGFSNTYNQAALRYSQSDHHATVFSLDYRTAPKYRFPAALNDAIDGYRWLLQHGYQPQNIIIAGDSSGAGLSLALTLYLRDHKLALPRALVLASPWTDLTASGSSYHTKVTSDPLFGSSTIKTAPKYPVPITYAGSHNLKDPYLSPAFGNFKGLPPMLIQTGSHELLLSDSTTVVKKARAAHVQVKFVEFSGMYHIFYISTPQIPEAQRAWQNITSFIAKHS